MSRTLASSSGSVENLNVPDRCGWIPKCFQILATVAWETALPWRRSRSANNRLDQCVMPSSAGGSVKVTAKISSRIDWSIVGGFPERASSTSPPNPRSANRDLHRITVGSLQPTRSAISTPGTPSAASSTIRARSTTRAGSPLARTRRRSTARSSSVIVSVRTRFGMHHCLASTLKKLL
jgi:hypothetical protein